MVGGYDELVLPMLAKGGLEVGRDFFLCFSPERVDPGNPRYQTVNIPKVVGGSTPACTQVGRLFYSQALHTSETRKCAVPVEDFDFDWRAMGAEIESHAHFPHRTNVSFLVPVDRHTIDVRFYERGAGETMSSGTGSTGAMVAAVARGMAESPVEVLTPAGPMHLRLEREHVHLTGPAEIVAEGEWLGEV